MRLFKEIAGKDEDANKLLEASLNKAKNRVVVKRPLRAAFVNKTAPHFSISGKSSRFDIYTIAD